jgi:hypothetical protein
VACRPALDWHTFDSVDCANQQSFPQKKKTCLLTASILDQAERTGFAGRSISGFRVQRRKRCTVSVVVVRSRVRPTGQVSRRSKREASRMVGGGSHVRGGATFFGKTLTIAPSGCRIDCWRRNRDPGPGGHLGICLSLYLLHSLAEKILHPTCERSLQNGSPVLWTANALATGINSSSVESG